MPFTVQEIENAANAAIDFHFARGEVFSQTIQNKPLLREMQKKRNTFPGGKGEITVRVKGDYTTEIQGYEHDDTVDYANPANIKTASFPWKEIHWGISCTLTELKIDGISISDTATGEGETNHDQRELTMLANLLKDKVEDMKEGAERGLNEMYWLDGTQDSKVIPGIKSFVVDDPTEVISVAGLDQGVHTWWRNRANLAINVGADPASQVLINFLQTEMRQLRRYGDPQHIALCGTEWMTQLEKELRAKGNYTMTGWSGKGTQDAAIKGLAFDGVVFEYDPTLDDMDEADRCYFLDMASIMPMNMAGEYMKRHNPARPANQYTLYRAVTLTGGLICKRRNTSGVYKIV